MSLPRFLFRISAITARRNQTPSTGSPEACLWLGFIRIRRPKKGINYLIAQRKSPPRGSGGAAWRWAHSWNEASQNSWSPGLPVQADLGVLQTRWLPASSILLFVRFYRLFDLGPSRRLPAGAVAHRSSQLSPQSGRARLHFFLFFSFLRPCFVFFSCSF